jgi:hypothetical protein
MAVSDGEEKWKSRQGIRGRIQPDDDLSWPAVALRMVERKLFHNQQLIRLVESGEPLRHVSPSVSRDGNSNTNYGVVSLSLHSLGALAHETEPVLVW